MDDDDAYDPRGSQSPQLINDDEDDEPADIDLDDLDPINSGQATPALGAVGEKLEKRKHWKQQFAKKKETKTIKGETFTIVDDELILEDDPRGEAKIDADGNLLGGRQFKVATFTSPLRRTPTKQYMLSIDAARASGYRDSLYFFRRNPLVHKLSCTQTEKDTLIGLGRLSSNLKSRAVTMVSARNCFKVMGASFVLNGKHVFDDYYEDKAIAAGHKPGEPAYVEHYDPDKDSGILASAKGPPPAGATGSGLHGPASKPRPTDLRTTNSSGPARDDYITSQIGGGLNATFGGNGLQPFGKTWDPAAKKAKPASHLSVENWMFEYGKSVWEHNNDLGVVRKMNVGQVQVGLDVVEREEDAWDEVEEEVEIGPEDEEEEEAITTNPMEESDAERSTTGEVGGALLDVFQFPSDDARSIKLDGASPSPFPPPQPTTRKKIIKVYNPIRGIYDPETNVPHVFKSTQATMSNLIRIDAFPDVPLGRIDSSSTGTWEEQAEEDEKERPTKKMKLSEQAAKKGIATIEYVVDESAFGREEDLIPGMWDFRKGLDWDSLEGEEIMVIEEVRKK